MTKPREKTREEVTAQIEDGGQGMALQDREGGGCASRGGKKRKFSPEETGRFSFPRLGGRGAGGGLANGAKAAILE